MLAAVPLCAVVDVVQHHHAGVEVHRLARRQEVQVGTAIPTPVAIAVSHVRVKVSAV